MGCQPGSSESAPCVTCSVLGSPPLQHGPPLPGGRRPLTHSPRREVVSGPAHTRGAHPTASGRHAVAVRTLSLWVASPGDMSQPPFSTDRSLGRRPCCNSGVVYAVVPCGHRGSSFTAWVEQQLGPNHLVAVLTFGNEHMSTRTTESENASLAHIAVSTIPERAGFVQHLYQRASVKT